MSLLRELVAAARALPAETERRFAAWVDGVVLGQHQQVTLPNGSPWCLRDRTPWPCPTVRRVMDRKSQRAGGDGGGGNGPTT